jgi:hypothetical protein
MEVMMFLVIMNRYWNRDWNGYRNWMRLRTSGQYDDTSSGLLANPLRQHYLSKYKEENTRFHEESVHL